MKTCPYCGQEFPIKESKCPSCGAEYWEPNQPAGLDESRDQQEEGCLSIFLLPFLISLAATAILIFVGFLVNMIAHFEENQIKIIWIGSSLVLGFIFFILVSKIKKKIKGKSEKYLQSRREIK